MGNDTSRSSASVDNTSGVDAHAWRILHVYPNSPSSGKSIIPYIECITHIDNVALSGSEQSLIDTVRENEVATYTLYNIVTKRVRDIQIHAQRFSTGTGLLGLMIRYQNLANWRIECIHVIDVYAGSPAATAGLCSNDDYMLGTPTLVFRGYAQLDSWLAEHEDTASTVYVYNAKRQSIRVCTIKPSTQWSNTLAENQQINNSRLGADVGVGYLHSIPLDAQRDIIVESTVQSASGSVQQSEVSELPVTGLQPDNTITASQLQATQAVQHPAHIPQEAQVQNTLPRAYQPPSFKPIPQQFVPTSSSQLVQPTTQTAQSDQSQQTTANQQQSYRPYVPHSTV